MATCLDLSLLEQRVYPSAIGVAGSSGQYYFSLNPCAQGWRFSVSGPGPNGECHAKAIIDRDDPVITSLGIHHVANQLYQLFVERWPTVHLVSRMCY